MHEHHAPHHPINLLQFRYFIIVRIYRLIVCELRPPSKLRFLTCSRIASLPRARGVRSQCHIKFKAYAGQAVHNWQGLPSWKWSRLGHSLRACPQGFFFKKKRLAGQLAAENFCIACVHINIHIKYKCILVVSATLYIRARACTYVVRTMMLLLYYSICIRTKS
jgi:hypothetical protein